jgi:polysaccharide pyruvyl transferase WcaK-like protein
VLARDRRIEGSCDVNIFCLRPKGFNVGNEAIFQGMKVFITEAFGYLPNLISLPATSRYESQRKGGLTSKTIYEINEYGCGVVIGGGNLYENNELDVDLNALRALNVPLLLFSLSRGRIYSRHGALVERTDVMPDRTLTALHEQAFLGLPRDNATHAYLKSLGIDNVRVGACPTMFLRKIADRFDGVTEHDRGLALVSVRNPDVMNIPRSMKPRVFTHVEQIVRFLRDKGHRVKLLCHDQRDLAFVSCLSDVEYIYTDDIYLYLALLKHCSLVVAYRLHSTLPCLSFGRPVINISYDERANSLLETIGYGEWNLDMVRSHDLLADVRDRYERLAELPTLQAKNEPVWTHYEGVMRDAFRQFAARVKQEAT